MTDLKFAYLSPDALKPDSRNARTHPKKQVAQIAASLSATAFANPILVDEDNVIIAGHGRLLAAKSLSLTQVPVIVIAGLSDIQKRALRLADNKIAQGAGWDRDLLRLELKEIEIAGYDVELTGFNMGEIDALRVIGDPDDELVPEPSETRRRYSRFQSPTPRAHFGNWHGNVPSLRGRPSIVSAVTT